jgi:hypothetical protein
MRPSVGANPLQSALNLHANLHRKKQDALALLLWNRRESSRRTVPLRWRNRSNKNPFLEELQVPDRADFIIAGCLKQY